LQRGQRRITKSGNSGSSGDSDAISLIRYAGHHSPRAVQTRIYVQPSKVSVHKARTPGYLSTVSNWKLRDSRWRPMHWSRYPRSCRGPKAIRRKMAPLKWRSTWAGPREPSAHPASLLRRHKLGNWRQTLEAPLCSQNWRLLYFPPNMTAFSGTICIRMVRVIYALDMPLARCYPDRNGYLINGFMNEVKSLKGHVDSTRKRGKFELQTNRLSIGHKTIPKTSNVTIF